MAMTPTPGEGRVFPGYVNAHTHLYSGLAPFGMPAPATPPPDFMAILEQVWWRLDRAIDEASLRASVRWYVAQALLAGTTTLIDHHESPAFIERSLDVIAETCDELGIRALLCYGATERNGGHEEAQRGLTECARFIASNRRPRVRGLVGLHASFTLSRESLREAGRIARALGVAVHVHVAEDHADVDHARRDGAAGPLERLLEERALPAGSILAHGVHLDEAAVRMAEGRGLWLVQNPRSNEGNRVGYPASLAASTHVALGTDGYASDMREEFVSLQRLAAVHERATPLAVLEARLGAGSLLIDRHFGPGELARDEVEYEAPKAGARPSAKRVVIAGRTVVEDGRLLAADLAEIEHEARAQAARLWTGMVAS
jgi:cytosine/adenosine deaminase-related metal-dependent hydrolase